MNFKIQIIKGFFSTTTKPKSTEPVTFKTVNAITTTNYKEKIKPDHLVETDDLSGLFEWIEDGRLNRKVDNETNSTEITTENTTVTEFTTNDDARELSDTTTSEITSTLKYITDNLIAAETSSYEQSTEPENTSTTENIITSTTDLASNVSYPVTLKTILNSTDCIKSKENLLELLQNNRIEVTTLLPVDANEINKLADLRKNSYEEYFTTTDSEEDSTETTTAEDVTEVDLVGRVNVASATLRNIPNIPNLQPELEAILNITKHKSEDYEYDYNEPSLPPSLPNLRIIPFVAADALDPKKDISKENVIYPQERVTDTSFGYTNLFSPPIETEGGFVPKGPPILDNFYENAVTVPSITIDPKPNNGELKPFNHLPTFTDDEAPTVVLDRHEGTSNVQEIVTVAERVITPDPFRDVIRTEPAPNLQSLIVDMMPFLARKTTTPLPQIVTEKPLQQTTLKIVEENDNKTDEGFSLDKVLQLLFSGDSAEKTETYTNKIQTTVFKPADRLSIGLTTLAPSSNDKFNSTDTFTENLEQHEGVQDSNSNHPNNVDSPGVGLLKLAGCNIYGRMYRVGRIISELSSPCLECKCTEVGVQCKALKC
ncbi:hypothetical protein NQ314_008276 [Rhamnusium bicolor]|uniref:Uncharacterized protein n=1 Tax=Rhamnusium bicolor TaxID=1586634 RepID=A0AAV8YEM3_9CUCU|nr:hypothetical protein NQ314_008276 [Rhamnusium bicolor]